MATQTEDQISISRNTRSRADRFWPDAFYLKHEQCVPRQGLDRPHGQSSQAIHAGHPSPPEEFTALHIQRMFHAAYRITGNREDAEDAVQDAFLRATVHIKDFKGRSKLSTWLIRIAINSSLMILRKRKTGKTVSLDDTVDSEESKEFPEVKDFGPNPEQKCLQKEKETVLRQEINALRPILKAAIELSHFEEWSLRETAETLGVTINATKSRLFHARRALRDSRKLRPFCNERPTPDACRLST